LCRAVGFPVNEFDVVVVGGGQAGISLSFYLKQKGISHVVLEKERPFSSWHSRWDGFRANTPNWMNTLPVLAADVVPSHDPGAFATRDELIDYLDECLRAVDPPIKTGIEVQRVVEVDEDFWEVLTRDDVYRARCVAVCTGAMSAPRLPGGAAGVPRFVPQLHSSGYRNPDQIETGSVLVVGTGTSGVQIGRLLCESGKFEQIHFAVSRVLVLPRRILGIQTHRLVHSFGLFDVRTDSAIGRFMYSGLETRGDPIMRPTTRGLHKKYGARIHGRFAAADDAFVRFSDGTALPLDDLSIIWCTGFRPNYEFVDLPDRDAAFHPTGHPKHVRGVVDAAPGLYFVGLRYQHTVASHDIYGVAKDAEFVADRIEERLSMPSAGGATNRGATSPLRLVPVDCRVCGSKDAELIGSGYDYEYWTAPDEFHAYRCRDCGNVYMNPRPDVAEFSRIYPSSYHSLAFSEENFSFVHKVRSRLEANRLLRYCEGVPPDARILDVGCGDGFHLRLLRDYGESTWTVEGVDVDSRAVAMATRDGLRIHEGSIEDLDLPRDHYDVVYTIQTVEHVADPYGMMTAIHRVLKPGGRLVVVTDNTESIDFGWFKKGYWGGYHFPRHWNLFHRSSLARLATRAGYETEKIETIVSPVNWVYSIHNYLVARRAPEWLVNRFTLKSPVSLGIFTMLDMVLQKVGRGALLNAFFTKS
jgi:cation diffusion facilitator CzcD-associated flavoprotein CzcO/SAM-dependent methyltransferase